MARQAEGCMESVVGSRRATSRRLRKVATRRFTEEMKEGFAKKDAVTNETQ